MPDIPLPDEDELPNVVESELVEVHGQNGHTRTVGMVGLLTGDPNLYRPGAFGGGAATIEPVTEAAVKWKKRMENEAGVDLFLPLTHQVMDTNDWSPHPPSPASSPSLLAFLITPHPSSLGEVMAEDRAMAEAGLGVPLIIGAHDHQPYQETVNGCQIIKTGMDAVNIAIIDIVWGSPEDSAPSITIRQDPHPNSTRSPTLSWQ